MNYFSVNCVALIGDRAEMIKIECVQQRRLPFLQIIGLPAGAAAAQRERVMAAVESAGFRLPSRRITVSLAGAAGLTAPEQTDLAVALAVLGSARQVPAPPLERAVVCGGLSLEGRILPLACRSPLRAWIEDAGHPPALLPWDDSQLLLPHGKGGGFRTLQELVGFLRAGGEQGPRLAPSGCEEPSDSGGAWRFLENKPLAGRISQIAAAGGHPILLTGGSAGEGVELAKALLSLLPPLSLCQKEEVVAIHRKLGERPPEGRPCRLVRSDQASRLLRHDPGTGYWGEMSLAHGGLLLLQNLGEKPAALLGRVQEPLEVGFIRSFRGGKMTRCQADWLLLAQVGACPCGAAEEGACHCLPQERSRFRVRLARSIGTFQLGLDLSSETGREVWSGFERTRAEVQLARQAALLRSGNLNARLRLEEALQAKPWSKEAQQAHRSVPLGMQAAVARVALTVSDLRKGERVERPDVLEARHYSPASSADSGMSLARASAPDRKSRAIP